MKKLNFFRGISIIMIATLAAMSLTFTACSEGSGVLYGDLDELVPPGPDGEDKDKSIKSVTLAECAFVNFSQTSISTDSVYTIPANFRGKLTVLYKDASIPPKQVDTTWIVKHTAKFAVAGKYISSKEIFKSNKREGSTFLFGGGEVVVNVNLKSELPVMVYKGFKIDVCNVLRDSITYLGFTYEGTGKTEGDWEEIKIRQDYRNHFEPDGDKDRKVDVSAPEFNIWAPKAGTDPEIPTPDEKLIGANEIPSKHQVLSHRFEYQTGKVISHESLRLYYEMIYNTKRDTLYVDKNTQSTLTYSNGSEQELKELKFSLTGDDDFAITLNGRAYNFSETHEKVSIKVGEKFDIEFSLFGRFTNVDYRTTTTAANGSDSDFEKHIATHQMRFDHQLEKARDGQFSFTQPIKIAKAKEELLSLVKISENIDGTFSRKVDAKRVWSIKGDEPFSFLRSLNLTTQKSNDLVIYKANKDLVLNGNSSMSDNLVNAINETNFKGERRSFGQSFNFGKDLSGNDVTASITAVLDAIMSYQEGTKGFELNNIKPGFSASVGTAQVGKDGIYDTYRYPVTITTNVEGKTKTDIVNITVMVLNYVEDPIFGEALAEFSSVTLSFHRNRDIQEMILSVGYEKGVKQYVISKSNGTLSGERTGMYGSELQKPTSLMCGLRNGGDSQWTFGQINTPNFGLAQWAWWEQLPLEKDITGQKIDGVTIVTSGIYNPVICSEANGRIQKIGKAIKVTIPGSAIGGIDKIYYF